jgi:Ca2+-binding EF-hand superfamily protein
MKTRTLLASLCTAAALSLAAPLASANKDNMDEKFAMMDADGNGKISSGEHEDFSEKHFKMMDKNSDGSVTKDEMKLAKDAMHGKK